MTLQAGENIIIDNTNIGQKFCFGIFELTGTHLTQRVACSRSLYECRCLRSRQQMWRRPRFVSDVQTSRVARQLRMCYNRRCLSLLQQTMLVVGVNCLPIKSGSSLQGIFKLSPFYLTLVGVIAELEYSLEVAEWF